jgi:hypothetical protein
MHILMMFDVENIFMSVVDVYEDAQEAISAMIQNYAIMANPGSHEHAQLTKPKALYDPYTALLMGHIDYTSAARGYGILYRVQTFTLPATKGSYAHTTREINAQRDLDSEFSGAVYPAGTLVKVLKVLRPTPQTLDLTHLVSFSDSPDDHWFINPAWLRVSPYQAELHAAWSARHPQRDYVGVARRLGMAYGGDWSAFSYELLDKALEYEEKMSQYPLHAVQDAMTDWHATHFEI